MIKDFIKDITKYIPSKIIPGIVGFISIPIITRIFPPQDYGNYSLVIATIVVITTLLGWISMSIIRFQPAYERDKRTDIFYSSVITSTFVSITIVTLISSIILFSAKPFISPQLYFLMLIGIVVLIPTSLFNVLLCFLMSKRLAGFYSIFSTWKSIGSLGIALLLIFFFKRGIESLLWGTIICVLTILPFLWRKVLGGVSSLHFKIDSLLLKEMGMYSTPLVMGNLAAWILSLSDRYVIKFFLGSNEVGIYTASYGIAERGLMLITTLFMLASGPISMNIWERDGIKASQEFITKVTRYFLIICLPAVIGLSVLAKPIINLLTAKEYHEGFRIIPLVAFGVFFLGLQQRFDLGLLYYKKTHFLMFGTIISGLLNLTLNFILIPKYGYIAAAATTLISYSFLLVIMIILSRRFFVWEFPFKTLGKVTCASAIMGIVVSYICNRLTYSIQFNLILVICIGILLYFILLFLFREFQHREQEIMKQVLKKYLLKLLIWC